MFSSARPLVAVGVVNPITHSSFYAGHVVLVYVCVNAYERTLIHVSGARTNHGISPGEHDNDDGGNTDHGQDDAYRNKGSCETNQCEN